MRFLIFAALSTLLLILAGCNHSDDCAQTEVAPAPGRHSSFDVRHELKVQIPTGARRLRIWFVLPQETPVQSVADLKIETPYPYRITYDSEGNRMLYIETVDPALNSVVVLTTFSLMRYEESSDISPLKSRPLSEQERAKFARYLGPNRNIVMNDRIAELSKQIVGNEKNSIHAARKLYDWELANVNYWVKDPATKKASPVGSSEYCLSTKTGNCSDFNSLWTALARSQGIPTRIVYGSFFKSELDGQDVDQSYHCWIEFYAQGAGWIPHDVAVANIYYGDITLTKDNQTLVARSTGDGYHGPDPKKVDYYFGNIDERRVAWSQGRDLTLNPRQDGDPINAMIKAYVEIDGKAVLENKETGWSRKLTYREKKN